MRKVEERAQLDEFDLEDNYDFSNAIRGRFYNSKKVSTTLQLDNDVLLYLKKQAGEKHISYQSFVNALLREHMTAIENK